MELTEKVYDTIIRRSMISSGDNVIAGLSGGADSVCLLLVLRKLSERIGFSLSAVHVNHCLRGEESDGDEQFCRDLCAGLSIPISVYKVDVNARSAETGESTEEAARELRYEAFAAESEKFSSPKIATAHNKCDNSETVLFNLTRGTGIKGMCGIPYTRGNIIRPLLDAERAEIEGFLRESGQSYVTDSTNLSDDYTRNKIRHCVIPVLTEINGGFYSAVSRLSANAQEDEEYFSALLDEISPESVCNQPAAVRKRYIRRLLADNNIECSYERLCALDENMRTKKCTKYNLSGDIFAVFRNGIMTVEKISDISVPDVSEEIKFEDGAEIIIPEFDKIVKITRVCDDIFCADSIIHKNLTNNLVNYVKIQGVAVVRNKRSGDSIVLKGRNFSTKLKKLYNSMKIPVECRAAALVIEDGEGIIWSEYGGACDRVSPRADSRPEDVYEISVIRR